MARIRTVKPDLFRHEALFEAEIETKLPLRLAFIGLFTTCDREGRFKWKPKTLKLDVMPYDEIDFSRVLEALVAHGFIVKYDFENELYGCIPSWLKHQVINNKESKSLLPSIDSATNLTREPRVSHASTTPLFLDQGEGKGKGREKEGNGMEEEWNNELSINELLTDEPIIKNSAKPKIPNCQYQAVIEIYNETLPELPRAVALNTKREKLIKARWNWLFTSKKQNKEPRALNAEQALDWFREFFLCAKEDDFLMGRTQRRSGFETWTCSIDYLLEDRCLTKILEKTQA